MLFHFQLRPLAEVTPWGYPEQSRLHWFGLTDGWYWLHINEHNELFRYSEQLLAHWRQRYPQQTIASPYVDYYVVRLWEDILEMLPAILEPLPPELAHMLGTEEKVHQWQQQVKQWQEEIELQDETWETYSHAVTWWDHRRLNAGYLTPSPHIWFWNDGQYIHCFWDNSQVYSEGLSAWQAQRGLIHLTHSQWLDEVDSFHTRLFIAMQERIQAAKHSWPRPEVALDIFALEKEQQDRLHWLARATDRAASTSTTPWNTIINAIRTLPGSFHSQPT